MFGGSKYLLRRCDWMSGVTCKPTGLKNGWLLELPGYTLPETNIFAPKNGWFPIGISKIPGGPLFSGDMFVSEYTVYVFPGSWLEFSQCQVAGMVVHFELGMTEDDPDSPSCLFGGLCVQARNACTQIPSMGLYRIFIYIWLIFMGNVCKYTIHGCVMGWRNLSLFWNLCVKTRADTRKCKVWEFGDFYTALQVLPWPPCLFLVQLVRLPGEFSPPISSWIYGVCFNSLIRHGSAQHFDLDDAANVKNLKKKEVRKDVPGSVC